MEIMSHKLNLLNEVALNNQFILAPINENTLILGWGDCEEYSKPLLNKWCFYKNDFFTSSSTPWITFKNNETLNKSDFKNLETTHEKNIKFDWSPPSFSQFESHFKEIKKLIHLNTIQKIVPIVFEKSNESFSKNKYFQILKNVIIDWSNEKISGYPYGFSNKNSSLLGITPEFLIEKQKNLFRSMALAGTKKSSNQFSLLQDKKEMHEHNLVIQDIVDKLKAKNIHATIDITTEKNFGSLTHLRTFLNWKNSEFDISDISDLIATLHPTSALGGYPTQSSSEWLKKFRSNEVQYFGAPFGILSPTLDFLIIVSIRNFIWNNHGLLIPSGCGIVEKSELSKEWEELKSKRTFVKSVLGLE